MARPSLNNGDVWTPAIANASIRPFASDLDEPGAFPLVRNQDMTSAPGNVKYDLYNFLDRIQATPTTGLLVSWQEYVVVLQNGVDVVKAAGQLSLPDNSTRYIVLNSSGDMTAVSAVPNEGKLLYRVVTSGGSVTEFKDLRFEAVAGIGVIKLPPNIEYVQIGDIVETARSGGRSGYLACDGSSYDTTQYPALFAAIGYAFGQDGTKFRVPDKRDRVSVGVSVTKPRGSTGGNETRRLTPAQLPSHEHPLIDGGHTHSTNEQAHTHPIQDNGHGHALNDPGHLHNTRKNRAVIPGVDDQGGAAGAELSNATSMQGNPFWNTAASVTNITVAPSTANVSVRPARTNVTVEVNTSNTRVGAAGGNGEFSIMQPYVATTFLIRAE